MSLVFTFVSDPLPQDGLTMHLISTSVSDPKSLNPDPDKDLTESGLFFKNLYVLNPQKKPIERNICQLADAFLKPLKFNVLKNKNIFS